MFCLVRYVPLVLADHLAVRVVVETGDAAGVGGADQVAVAVVMVNGFLGIAFVIVGDAVVQTA